MNEFYDTEYWVLIWMRQSYDCYLVDDFYRLMVINHFDYRLFPFSNN